MHIIRITEGFKDLVPVEQLAREAFPPEEYLAPAKLIEMSQRGEVDFLALYDGDAFVGFTVVSVYQEMVYLFFLAIEPSLRSKGYGGQVLRLLEARYPDKQQVVDFEMIDRTAPNNAQRITRKAFYLRNGYGETGHYLSYLGVDYEILCKSGPFDLAMFQQLMGRFQIENFAPRYFQK